MYVHDNGLLSLAVMRTSPDSSLSDALAFRASLRLKSGEVLIIRYVEHIEQICTFWLPLILTMDLAKYGGLFNNKLNFLYTQKAMFKSQKLRFCEHYP